MTLSQLLRVPLLAGALALISLPVLSEEGPKALVVVDVPFIAQTEDLCGGAAAAMVLRYWGVADVQAEDFASLVDHSKGGITTGDLVHSLIARGMIVRPIRAEGEDVAREVSSGRPVVALIDAGAGRFHYVVIVAWANGRVLFHDPSVGPFRVRSEAEFGRLWRATDGFAMIMAPGEIAAKASPLTPAARPAITPRKTTPCDSLVDQAVAVARGEDPEAAVPALTAATEMCPGDARSRSALAGVRFRQKRWRESADFAAQATERDVTDAESWRLLGAARYLSDEPRPALAAWNRIGEPKVDRVQIDGLIRTRQDIATAVLALPPRELLTEKRIAEAQRRLEQLPTASNPRITYRPLAGGLADVVASVGEAGLIESWPILALRIGVSAIARKEGEIQFNSPTHRGETFRIGGRFETNRPSFWTELATPRFAGLPGVFAINGLWDRQTYRASSSARGPLAIETRRGGGVEWSHWQGASVRLDLGLGLDLFHGRGGYGSVHAGVDTRGLKDRVALLADGTSWLTTSDRPGFSEFGGAFAFRTSVRPRRLALNARVEGRRASDEAPLALWPGAGTGLGRLWLLRASPLVQDGVVTGDAFGRGLLHATLETELQVAKVSIARVGLAAFVDWAKPWNAISRSGPSPGIFAVGAGLRLRALSATNLRVDLAKRPDRKGIVFSAGLTAPWPH